MTIADLVQLYAPMVGLLALSFWVGGLSQRVKALERDTIGAGLAEKVTRLEVQMESALKSLESMDRTLQGVNRQLANIATAKTAVYEISNPPQAE